MNPQTWKSFDRLLSRMERRARRPSRRIPTAPVLLGLALIVGELLLTRLVPAIWESLLPRGLAQAETLRGWPALVWWSAVYCHHHERRIQVAIGVIAIISFLLCLRLRPVRVVAWLAALGVILVDAGILIVTIQTSLSATATDA